MSEQIEIRLPDIGDFDDVEVIEIAVSRGAEINGEDVLVVIESDKASMDVPSPSAGTIIEIAVEVGDRISTGHLLARLEVDTESSTPRSTATTGETRYAESQPPLDTTTALPERQPTPHAVPPASPGGDDGAVDVVVLGSGPGGYTAAFRAADLGLSTVLVERYATLGGVCLNVGCIPSKALLHAAEVLDDARAFKSHGIDFGSPKIDLSKLAEFKNGTVERLTHGLTGLAHQRNVKVVHGIGEFIDSNHLRVVDSGQNSGEATTIAFKHAIVAAGSEPAPLPNAPEDPRIIDSTGALALEDIPKKLLVVGGGIIGLEMATVYAALGSRVTVVELLDTLMPGCDADLVKPLRRRLEERFEAIYLSTKVAAVKPQKQRIKVEFSGEAAPSSGLFDKVLVAIGRRPNGHQLGLNSAGVKVDERGFVPVDSQQRTNVGHIFAIGDLCGPPMLAHKATHEAKVAAEVIAGHKSHFEPLGIPSVAYTDPEIAWVGLTEEAAQEQQRKVDKGVFPWAASGRAQGMGRAEGFTKLLFDPVHGRLLGVGIVGRHAGDLISEAALALELGADAEDIALTIHPHPTLSETFNFAAEMLTGSITDLYVPRRKTPQ